MEIFIYSRQWFDFRAAWVDFRAVWFDFRAVRVDFRAVWFDFRAVRVDYKKFCRKRALTVLSPTCDRQNNTVRQHNRITNFISKISLSADSCSQGCGLTQPRWAKGSCRRGPFPTRGSPSRVRLSPSACFRPNLCSARPLRCTIRARSRLPTQLLPVGSLIFSLTTLPDKTFAAAAMILSPTPTNGKTPGSRARCE